MAPTRTRQIEVPLGRGPSDDLPFYCVSPVKLSVLSLATFGLYELFWFYKNWALVKAASGRQISPFWRAFFARLFSYSFATTVGLAAESATGSTRIRPVPIAVAYFVLAALSQLPDEYWLLCLFSFVPLIPIAQEIRAVHESIRPGFDSVRGWNGWSYLTLAVGGSLTALALVGTFSLPRQALPGPGLSPSYQSELAEAGVLEPDESIVFFYSAGFFSILEDGNLLTEERVISYETVDGELRIASATYPEIRDHAVAYAEGFFDPTVITISTTNHERFLLVVSSKDEGDRAFVSELERRIRAGD